MVGARLPHLVLPDSSRPISTLDTTSDGFALLIEDGQAGWQEAASALDIPVAVHALKPGDLPPGGALLRPDGVIAWRLDRAGDQAVEQLRSVLSGLLSRS
jgi:hypothetical protein